MKGIIDASSIDISNVVFMEVSNPYYSGDGINVMELSFKYPEEKWLSEYYEYYKS